MKQDDNSVCRASHNKASVALVSVTPEADVLLVFAKRTRHMESAQDLEAVRRLRVEDPERFAEELGYVFTTIGSSQEFVDYTFLITGVTRAFTHQLVRHRVGTSFAQQTQRATQMTDFDYLATGQCINKLVYHGAMARIQDSYRALLHEGVPAQDARGILPTNILTNILFKVNLRALGGIMDARLCVRAQGEFQNITYLMRKCVLSVHPWAEPLMRPFCLKHNSCLFPRFKECAVKPHLPQVSPEAVEGMMEIWRQQLGKDVQPTQQFKEK